MIDLRECNIVNMFVKVTPSHDPCFWKTMCLSGIILWEIKSEATNDIRPLQSHAPGEDLPHLTTQNSLEDVEPMKFLFMSDARKIVGDPSH